MALAEAVWIDPPRSYDRRRQIVTTSGGSEHRISGDAQVAGTPRSPLLRLLMRSPFLSTSKSSALLPPMSADRVFV
mgnify:CR=1 FL=1